MLQPDRFPEHGSSYVALMPPPDAVVTCRDQVFVFLTAADDYDIENKNNQGDVNVTADDIVINLEDSVEERRETLVREMCATVSAFTS